jgi:hypothetical protein
MSIQHTILLICTWLQNMAAGEAAHQQQKASLRQSTTLKTRLSGSGTTAGGDSSSSPSGTAQQQSVQRSQSRFGRESQQGQPQLGDGAGSAGSGSGNGNSPPASPGRQPQSPHNRQGSQTRAEGLYEGVADLSALGISAEQLGDIKKTYVDWDACNKEALDIQMKLDTVSVTEVQSKSEGRGEERDVGHQAGRGGVSAGAG